MTDTITLPRKVVEKARKALTPMVYYTPPYERNEIAAILRTALAAPRLEVTVDPRLTQDEAAAISAALAAEPTKPEPVAWMDRFGFVFRGKGPHETFTTPLYTAPPSTHPGYVIGSHWLETAYSRICAGEAEADVLRDIGLVREEAFLTGVAHLKAENEALRRDAFRKGFYAGFAATGEGWNGEYPFQDKNRPIAGDPSVEAAIDAAMGDKT